MKKDSIFLLVLIFAGSLFAQNAVDYVKKWDGRNTLMSYNQKLWIGKNRKRKKKRFESDKMFLPQNNKPKETSYGYFTTNDRKRKHTLL